MNIFLKKYLFKSYGRKLQGKVNYLIKHFFLFLVIVYVPQNSRYLTFDINAVVLIVILC